MDELEVRIKSGTHLFSLLCFSSPFLLSLSLPLGPLDFNIWSKNYLKLIRLAYVKDTDYLESKKRGESTKPSKSMFRGRIHSRVVPLETNSYFSILAFWFRFLRDFYWLLYSQWFASLDQCTWTGIFPWPIRLWVEASHFGLSVLLVCWSCCNKAPQTEWLKQQK